MSTVTADPGLALAGDRAQEAVQGALRTSLTLLLDRAAEQRLETPHGPGPYQSAPTPVGEMALLANALITARQALAALEAQAAPATESREGRQLGSLLECIQDADLLKRESESEEDEQPIPSAVVSTVVALAAATQRLSPAWFRPRLATDGAGGVRMTWASGDSEIRAVLPASRERYLYVVRGSAQELIPNFDETALACQITKLFGDPRPRG